MIAGTVFVGVGGTVTVAEAKKPKLSGSITVSAAASLTEAFNEIGAEFEKQHKGTTSRSTSARRSTLVTQIQGGAPADVFASADRRTWTSS